MNFNTLSDKWEADNAFWNNRPRPDTFDLEPAGYAYSELNHMVKQQPAQYYRGDWVKAEDYQRDVERLEKLLKENGIEF